MKSRTKQAALDTANLVMKLPRNLACAVYGKQLLRSSSSVGAYYRSACRARSDMEMLAKLGIVEEEADESQYWLELLQDGGFCGGELPQRLHGEFGEIVAIIVASRRTLKGRIDRKGNSVR